MKIKIEMKMININFYRHCERSSNGARQSRG
jgi:hypothetical protein